MSELMQSCELCDKPGGILLWQSPACRVIRIDDTHYPGFCRVVWNAHVREMSDLEVRDQRYLMAVVLAVESIIRSQLQPLKINLASFGNMVPHLHWHVIPRWADDRHFPEPIWGAVRREQAPVRTLPTDAALIAVLSPLLDFLEAERLKPT